MAIVLDLARSFAAVRWSKPRQPTRERECIIWTYFQSTLGICSAIGKSPMTRNTFKHGYWAAPRGLQSQEVRSHNDIYIHTVSDHWSHLYQALSLESALCKILDVQKGNASFEHIFNPRWGSVVLLGSHLWIGAFLNMATELPPGDCKAKEPQLYPYCFRPKPWCIFWPILFHQRAPFVTFSVFRKGMHHLNICSIHVGDL